MEKKYILFDLDGTLTDSFEGITKSVQYALLHYDIKVDDLEELRKFIGPPLIDSFKAFYNFNEEESKKVVEKYRERFSKTGIFENRVYDGIYELLEKLKAENKILIVATSKPKIFADRIIKHFNLDKYFDDVCGSNLDGTLNDKSEVIAFAIKNNKIKNLEQVIMIGDRKHDIIGAKQNGIESVGVLYGYGSLEELTNEHADYIANDVLELGKILLDK